MTGERFNEYQIRLLRECFEIVDDTIEKIYREQIETNTAQSRYESGAAFWEMLTESVADFRQTYARIVSNDLEAVEMEKWQEIMFLLEIIQKGRYRSDPEKSGVLWRGLNVMVGMFRNQFPGEQWNPDDVRWTTVGQAGVRGISPMLMAIAEL